MRTCAADFGEVSAQHVLDPLVWRRGPVDAARVQGIEWLIGVERTPHGVGDGHDAVGAMHHEERRPLSLATNGLEHYRTWAGMRRDAAPRRSVAHVICRG